MARTERREQQQDAFALRATSTSRSTSALRKSPWWMISIAFHVVRGPRAARPSTRCRRPVPPKTTIDDHATNDDSSRRKSRRGPGGDRGDPGAGGRGEGARRSRTRRSPTTTRPTTTCPSTSRWARPRRLGRALRGPAEQQPARHRRRRRRRVQGPRRQQGPQRSGGGGRQEGRTTPCCTRCAGWPRTSRADGGWEARGLRQVVRRQGQHRRAARRPRQGHVRRGRHRPGAVRLPGRRLHEPRRPRVRQGRAPGPGLPQERAGRRGLLRPAQHAALHLQPRHRPPWPWSRPTA